MFTTLTRKQKKTYSILTHKFNIMFTITDGRGDYRIDARKIVDAIWTEYQSRGDAALWVYRIIEDYKKGKPSLIDNLI